MAVGEAVAEGYPTETVAFGRGTANLGPAGRNQGD